MVHGNLINIHRNSEIFKPIATDEITILTYYFKEFLGLGKKLIPTRLTSQSNEFCNLEAMVQVRCWRVSGKEGFRDGWELGIRWPDTALPQLRTHPSPHPPHLLWVPGPPSASLVMQCRFWWKPSKDAGMHWLSHLSTFFLGTAPFWWLPWGNEHTAGRGYQNTEGGEALHWCLSSRKFNRFICEMEIKTYYQPQGKKLRWMSSVPSSPKTMPVIYTKLRAKPTLQLSSSSNSGREEEFAFSHEESKDSLHTFLKRRTFRNLEKLMPYNLRV